MAYISYKKLWESEFHNKVCAKDRVQEINFNQLKLKVDDSYRKDEKVTTTFESSNDEYVTNKVYLDTKLSEIENQISYIEKSYNEFKLHNNKQSIEDNLIERAVRTTIQILYDKGLFDYYNDGDCRSIPAKPTGIKKEKDIPRLPEK